MNRGVVLSIALSSAVALAAACGNGGSPSNPTPPGGGGTQSPTDSSLTAPTLQAPTVGEAVKNLQPELQIGNASGGSGTRTYTYELALASSFQQIAVNETGVQEGLGGVTKWVVTESLAADTKYFWRVRASTSSGTGPYSDTSEFRVREAFISDSPTGDLVVFDPLVSGGSIGMVMGGEFVSGEGWKAKSNADCLRYQVPTLDNGVIEFQTTNVRSPNLFPGSRMLVSMWDPTKGEYTTNPFRMHLQKLDKSTAAIDDVRLRWISRGQEANLGISFYDFETDIVYSWRIEWGDFPGIRSQHVKVFLDGFEILKRNYDAVYHPKTHWIELGNCQRKETLEEAIWSNVRIGSR